MRCARTTRPDFSVLLVTDSLETAATTLRAFVTANDRWRLEAVLVVVGGGSIACEEVIGLGYAGVQVVDGGDGALNIAEIRGLHAATAPWIVLAQVGFLPRPGYVEAIAAALADGSVDMAGPSFSIRQPEQRLDRVFLRTAYGRWLPPFRPESLPLVAAHNSTYRRAVLLALNDRLEVLLEAGWALNQTLLERGCRANLVQEACIELAGPRGPFTYLMHMVRLGRRSAGQRSSRWTMPSRLIWAAGTPLLPGLFLARLLIRERVRGLRLPNSDLWLIVLGFMAQASGELVGFLAGPGPQARFHRPAQSD